MVTWKGGVTLANCVADAGLEWTGKKGHLPRTDVRTRTDHEVNNRRIDAYTSSAGSVGTLDVSSCRVRPTSGAGRCILIFVRYNKRDATCVHYDAHEMETYVSRERLITSETTTLSAVFPQQNCAWKRDATMSSFLFARAKLHAVQCSRPFLL